jgi:hypothetical protein
MTSPSAATARSSARSRRQKTSIRTNRRVLKGVLTVTLPKSAEAPKSTKTIAVKGRKAQLCVSGIKRMV